MTPGSGAPSNVPDALPAMVGIEQAPGFSYGVVDSSHTHATHHQQEHQEHFDHWPSNTSGNTVLSSPSWARRE